MTKTVVVLGGAYAGVQIAHRLLKYTQPHVKDLKVILVSKVRQGRSIIRFSDSKLYGVRMVWVQIGTTDEPVSRKLKGQR
jgi:hypothetical protein